ncbi:MAG: GPR endopeptidase [Limnochordia bacterium]|jgi:spore protease
MTIGQRHLEKYGVWTDLAVEARELIVHREGPPEIPGVEVETEELPHAFVTRMNITTDNGARIMDKAPGRYSTIEAPEMRERNKDIHMEISQALAGEIERFLADLGPEDPILVIGLGNWNATPDALGPKVVENLLVTRHLYEMTPPEVRGGLRPVAALAPGVLGLTGIETGETIQALAAKLNPRMVICIDALASRSVQRLATTIQISDTGINPGAGVGNKRLPINQETLGTSVLAIGVPTVIRAATIVTDAIEMAENPSQLQEPAIKEDLPQRTQFHIDPGNILNRGGGPAAPMPRREVVNSLLGPFFGDMIVTPKEIDVLIDDVAEIIAGGLNAALHKSLDLDDVVQYLQG